jgi:hypothetical protein
MNHNSTILAERFSRPNQNRDLEELSNTVMRTSILSQTGASPLSKNESTIARSKLKPKRKRHPSAFIGMVFVGVMCRAGALGITTYAVSNGLAVEANPVLNVATPSEFVFLAFLTLIVLYGILWAVPLSSGLRLSLTLLVTLASAIDLFHDSFLVYYHQVFLP